MGIRRAGDVKGTASVISSPASLFARSNGRSKTIMLAVAASVSEAIAPYGLGGLSREGYVRLGAQNAEQVQAGC